MSPASLAAESAADHFQRIAEGERGERARRAAAGALVLRALVGAARGEASPFTLLRAEREVASLDRSPERSILQRLLAGIAGGQAPGPRVSRAAIQYACELERTRRLAEADAAASVALSIDGGSAAAALHAARLARKLGERDRALALYCAARELDAGDGAIARLAAVGEAVVGQEPERQLTRAARAGRAAGDPEAAAVALEERAAARRSRGDRRGAARDLAIALRRYTDGVDRARAAHALAGVLLAEGDAEGAREALRIALVVGDRPQQDHARTRLHTLSRDVGDRVGMRRWRSFDRPSLVSLSAYRTARDVRSLAPRLRRWREAAED